MYLFVYLLVFMQIDLNRVSLLEAGICPFLAKQIVNCSESSREESTNDQYKSVVCGCVLNLAADNSKHGEKYLGVETFKDALID